MALLSDYTDQLNPRAIPSAPPGGGGLQIPSASYLPASSYANSRPAAQSVSPALLNFNPKALPGAYAGSSAVPQDWQKIIASDPDYMQWSLGAGERADTATSNRRAAMKALAIRFGGLSQNFSDVYGDIDPATAQMAADNPESESNRLLRNYNQQVEQSHRQLAARGMLQSGELGYGQNQLDLARQGDVYDLNNQFLDTAQGNISDYASIVAGLNSEQIDQIRAAADRIAAARLYQVPGGTTGTTGSTGYVDTHDPRDPRSSAYNAYLVGLEQHGPTYTGTGPGGTWDTQAILDWYAQQQKTGAYGAPSAIGQAPRAGAF